LLERIARNRRSKLNVTNGCEKGRAAAKLYRENYSAASPMLGKIDPGLGADRPNKKAA